MRRTGLLVIVSCMALLAGTSRAMADVGVLSFSGQRGVEVAALHDPGGALVSGVSVGTFGDIDGIGLSLAADYRHRRGGSGRSRLSLGRGRARAARVGSGAGEPTHGALALVRCRAVCEAYIESLPAPPPA
jgi:hypothetical protein